MNPSVPISPDRNQPTGSGRFHTGWTHFGCSVGLPSRTEHLQLRLSVEPSPSLLQFHLAELRIVPETCHAQNVFGAIKGGLGPEPLQLGEGVLGEVAPAVHVAVEVDGGSPVSLGRDHRGGTAIVKDRPEPVRVEGFVAEQAPQTMAIFLVKLELRR